MGCGLKPGWAKIFCLRFLVGFFNFFLGVRIYFDDAIASLDIALVSHSIKFYLVRINKELRLVRTTYMMMHDEVDLGYEGEIVCGQTKSWPVV